MFVAVAVTKAWMPMIFQHTFGITITAAIRRTAMLLLQLHQKNTLTCLVLFLVIFGH
jgi:hypothetical protein